MLSIFKSYPKLQTSLPYVSLGIFPTPVVKADKLAAKLQVGSIYIKNDGLSGQPYGGNKVRKLEFHLGKALKLGCKEVLTFGGAGSNHATATAVHAQKVGLKSISMLTTQPNANYVRRNLLKSFQSGAELHLSQTKKAQNFATKIQSLIHLLKTGKSPLIIPTGGTSPLGAIGFVNAGFELKEQIEKGLLAEPDLLYVALGSMGTAVGLSLGITAAGLKTRIIAVRVVSPASANLEKATTLFTETNALLHENDPSFKIFDFPQDRFQVREEFFGPGYAVFTKPGNDAVKLVDQTEGIKLEGTYTGKAFSALIADSDAGLLKGKNILFWNTHNAQNIMNVTNEVDYHKLPGKMHQYFQTEVQPEQ